MKNPVVPWVSGDYTAALYLEDTPWRSFTAGLQRLGGDPQATDLVAVLARLDDCARVAFARYNGKNDRTPDAGDLNDPHPYRGLTTPKTQ